MFKKDYIILIIKTHLYICITTMYILNSSQFCQLYLNKAKRNKLIFKTEKLFQNGILFCMLYKIFYLCKSFLCLVSQYEIMGLLVTVCSPFRGFSSRNGQPKVLKTHAEGQLLLLVPTYKYYQGLNLVPCKLPFQVRI